MDDDHGKAILAHEWLTSRVAASWDGEHSTEINGVMVLGAHGMGVAMMAHEMAHLVEIGDRRATATNFGLRYKRIVRLPPTRYSTGIYPEPLSAQGVGRECRVIAISVRILGAVGWATEPTWRDMENTIGALRHLQDWHNVPGRSDDARKDWCRRKVARALQQWPVERVRAEWWRKVILVTKRLERAQHRLRRATP